MYINVAPLLLNLMDCFTTLIFYEPIDFGLVKYPIATIQAGYEHYDNSSCAITYEETKSISWGELNARICPYVLNNYKIKGIRCVGVMNVYPPEGFGETDIYWYLNYYWSRSEKFIFKHDGYFERSELLFVPFSPSNVHIQTLTTMPDLRTRKFAKLTFLKYEWKLFIRLPLVIILINKLDVGRKRFVGETGIIFYGKAPVVIPLKIFSDSGLNPAKLIMWITYFRKYQLKVSIVGEPGITDGSRVYGENPLTRFLRDTFNRSRVVAALESNNAASLWTITYKRRIWLRYVIDSETAFLYGGKEHVVPITCSGLSPVASLTHLLAPYDSFSWISILILILVISALSIKFFKYRKVSANLSEALFATILEQSCEIFEKVKSSPFKLLIGTFILMGIILSNGYKGIVTTSVVKRFERIGIGSIQEALTKNFKLVEQPALLLLRNYCCQEKDGLSLSLDPSLYIPVRNMPRQLECRDVLIFMNRYVLLQHAQTADKLDTLQKEIILKGNLGGMAEGEKDTPREVLLLRLLHSMEPFQCKYPSLIDEFFACNKTLVLGGEEDFLMFSYLQKFNHSRKVEHPIYRITGQADMFRTYLECFQLFPLTIARNLLMTTVRAFDESGVKENMLATAKRISHMRLLRRMRKSFGRLVDQTALIIPISMNTNLYYTFLLYIYCLVLVLTTFIVEIMVSSHFCYIPYMKKWFQRVENN